jgi:hypothetical protein
LALGAAPFAQGTAPFNDSIRVADLKADLFFLAAMVSRAGSSARPRTRWRPSSCDRASSACHLAGDRKNKDPRIGLTFAWAGERT